MSWYRSSKYPCPRKEYCDTVGKLREDRVKRALEELLPKHQGYKVISHPINGNGPDIIIKLNGKVIGLFEVMNENLGSYIDEKRAKRIRHNLRGAKIKGLILSNKDSIKNRKVKKILKNIPIIEVGFQTLPRNFYEFYKGSGEILKRRIANDESLEFLKDKILSFILHNMPSMLYV